MSPIEHISPAPARLSLEQSRDAARSAYQDQERNRLAYALTVQQLRTRWQAEGSPAGDFTRFLGGEAGEHIPHSTVQDLLRAGEALERGITVGSLTEAVNAGRKLREATEAGQAIQEALPQIQEAADAGKLRRARNPGAPDGCTTAYLPVDAADTLELLRARMQTVAAAYRLSLPGGAPEQLATVISAVQQLPDEGLAALLGGGEHVLVRVDALQELMTRAGMSDADTR